jgi:hypothetical protein
VEVKTRTFQTDMTLDVTFKANDEGLEKPAAKILDDIARWGLQDFGGIVNVKGDNIEVDDLRQLLKNTLKIEDSTIRVGMDIKPKREK